MNYLASFWNLRLRPVDAILRYLKNGKTIKYQYIRILLANSVRIPADPLIEQYKWSQRTLTERFKNRQLNQKEMLESVERIIEESERLRLKLGKVI